MLNVFTLANGRLFQEEIESLEELSRFQPVWVDLESPTPDEKRWIKQYFGLSIPDDAMDEDIEESARFYTEDNGDLHIRSDFLIADNDDPRTVRVAFILNLVNPELRSKGVLFSIHDEDVPVFRLLRMRARRAPGLIEDAKEVLLKLFDADAEYSADTLEGIYDKLEAVSARVLKQDVGDAVDFEQDPARVAARRPPGQGWRCWQWARLRPLCHRSSACRWRPMPQSLRCCSAAWR